MEEELAKLQNKNMAMAIELKHYKRAENTEFKESSSELISKLSGDLKFLKPTFDSIVLSGAYTSGLK